MSDATAPLAVRWHRPLLWLAAACVPLTIACIVGLVVDQRELVGAPVWAKPLKFALSGLVYALTWSWLIGQLPRFQRAAWWAGTVAAAMLAFELVIIVTASALGVRSHFNVSSPFAITVWAVMAVSIGAVWGATLVVSILLFRHRLADPARTIAIRAGAVISLAGMLVAVLMTTPTSAQLADFHGVAGAHTVGLADGGPSLPVLGWSTVAGDLRVPHFVGMHALQVLPLLLIVLEWLARRVDLLRPARTRARLVLVAAAGYAAALLLLTVQALRGQSVVEPDGATLTAAAVIVVGVVLAGLVTLVRPAPLPAESAQA